MKKFEDRLYALLILFLTIMLPIKSAASGEAVKSGIEICLSVLIPSLFPFIFFSSLLCSYAGGVISALFSKIISPLFNISPSCVSAVVLGTLGGFPAGAAIASELYAEKQISRSEAERLPVFSNNSGVMFVIFAVGKGIFGSVRTGAALYVIHLFASLITGVLTRPVKYERGKKEPLKSALSGFSPPSVHTVFSKCIFSSVRSMAAICANFLVWRTVSFLLFSDAEGPIFALLKGLLEMTGGLFSLGSEPSFPIAAFLLGFNGLCIHMQTAALFFRHNLSVAKCIAGKFACACISFVLAASVSSKTPVFVLILIVILTAAVLFPAIKKSRNSSALKAFR